MHARLLSLVIDLFDSISDDSSMSLHNPEEVEKKTNIRPSFDESKSWLFSMHLLPRKSSMKIVTTKTFFLPSSCKIDSIKKTNQNNNRRPPIKSALIGYSTAIETIPIDVCSRSIRWMWSINDGNWSIPIPTSTNSFNSSTGNSSTANWTVSLSNGANEWHGKSTVSHRLFDWTRSMGLAVRVSVRIDEVENVESRSVRVTWHFDRAKIWSKRYS